MSSNLQLDISSCPTEIISNFMEFVCASERKKDVFYAMQVSKLFLSACDSALKAFWIRLKTHDVFEDIDLKEKMHSIEIAELHPLSRRKYCCKYGALFRILFNHLEGKRTKGFFAVTIRSFTVLKNELQFFQDQSIIILWENLKKEIINPPNIPLQNPNEGASAIRSWLKSNQASVKKITQLHLASVEIKVLASEVDMLINLKELTLRMSKIKIIASSTKTLPQLEKLDLSYNQLLIIPSWVGKLTMLTQLTMKSNQITEIPKWIGKLTRLTTLDLYSNHLVKLSDSMSNLTQLTDLDVSDNKIQMLPNWLGQMTNLAYLRTNYNFIKEYPISISNLRRLQKLDLSNMGLEKIPDSLKTLTQLETVNFNENKLTDLPDWISSFTKLDEFNLSSNCFSHIPVALTRMTWLKDLDLGNNQLSDTADWLGNSTQLYPLRNLHSLTSLSLSGNNFPFIGYWIGYLRRLKKLYLGYNYSLKKISYNISQLSELNTLNIAGAGLQAIPNGIRNLPRLKILDLHNNRILSLPDWLFNLPKLKELDISNNCLVTASYDRSFRFNNLRFKCSYACQYPQSIVKTDNNTSTWLMSYLWNPSSSQTEKTTAAHFLESKIINDPPFKEFFIFWFRQLRYLEKSA